MKLKAIEIKNYIGIKEFKWNPSPGFNVLEGPKGAGKSSVLEAIEKAFSNNSRRTEVVNHGESEATLYIQTDTGMEIDRRIRTDKADYLKLRQEGKGINSTEKELRQFINGDIFRPLDFINLPIEKQTSIILNMIDIKWSMEDIISWFGEEILGINYDKHILQILKDIENKLYKEREEINRQIRTLDIQVDMIKKGLPDNYDGEEWRNKNLQEYYNKVNETQKVNNYIEKANNLISSFESRIAAIKDGEENSKAKINMKYRDLKQECTNEIQSSSFKIEQLKASISNEDKELGVQLKSVDIKTEKAIQDFIADINAKAAKEKEKIKSLSDEKIEVQKQAIKENETKIATKNTEMTGLDEKESMEIEVIEKETKEKIRSEEDRIIAAQKYIKENEVSDIDVLQKEADKVAKMHTYLREWDKMQHIINGELAEKQRSSSKLTNQIETARVKPSDLLKTHKLPIDGISVDSDGLIRINGILLDGLSEGEKFEAAFKIALQRMGELKLMCLDGFEKLNKTEQLKVKQICEDNNIQCFVTITKDIDKEGFIARGEQNATE